jgi:Ca2+-binding EF-hand superfamily protein
VANLFDLFDRDGNGVIDFSELASGLSVLTGSSMDEKVQATFSLYDLNGDGFISLDEMTTYMTAVFRMMYATSAGMADKMDGVGPEELAAVTAQQCFEEADLNADGKLSFAEFKQWCVQTM